MGLGEGPEEGIVLGLEEGSEEGAVLGEAVVVFMSITGHKK